MPEAIFRHRGGDERRSERAEAPKATPAKKKRAPVKAPAGD
jgi:hypothetical protein